MSNSDNDDEYIPDAPVFCKRVRSEDLQSEVAKTTREGIEQLYIDVVDKLDTNKKEKQNMREKATYIKMINQSKLVDAIDQFFECDEDLQKAKFMNMVIETNRNSEKITQHEEKISSMEKTIEDLKENEEHLNELIDSYKEDQDEFKEKIKKLKYRILTQESLITTMKKKISTKNMYITQFVIVIGSYIFYRFYS